MACPDCSHQPAKHEEIPIPELVHRCTEVVEHTPGGFPVACGCSKTAAEASQLPAHGQAALPLVSSGGRRAVRR